VQSQKDRHSSAEFRPEKTCRGSSRNRLATAEVVKTSSSVPQFRRRVRGGRASDLNVLSTSHNVGKVSSVGRGGVFIAGGPAQKGGQGAKAKI